MWSGKKSNKESELLNVLQFLTGKEIRYDDGLPKKLCQPCFRKVKNIIEFRALSLAALSSQELLVGETSMKRVRCSEQAGESTSPSQQAKKTSLNRENIESVRMCLFVEGDQNHDKIPLSLDPLLPKITHLYHGAFQNFCKEIKKNMMPPKRGGFKCARVLRCGLFKPSS